MAVAHVASTLSANVGGRPDALIATSRACDSGVVSVVCVVTGLLVLGHLHLQEVLLTVGQMR